jgi:hypothetical protein
MTNSLCTPGVAYLNFFVKSLDPEVCSKLHKPMRIKLVSVSFQYSLTRVLLGRIGSYKIHIALHASYDDFLNPSEIAGLIKAVGKTLFNVETKFVQLSYREEPQDNGTSVLYNAVYRSDDALCLYITSSKYLAYQ